MNRAGVGIAIVAHSFPWNAADGLWTGFGHLFANNLLLSSRQSHVSLQGTAQELYHTSNQLRNNLYFPDTAGSFCAPANRTRRALRAEASACPSADRLDFSEWRRRTGLDESSLAADPRLAGEQRAAGFEEAAAFAPRRRAPPRSEMEVS